MHDEHVNDDEVDEEEVIPPGARRHPVTGRILNQNRGVPEGAQVFTD